MMIAVMPPKVVGQQQQIIGTERRHGESEPIIAK